MTTLYKGAVMNVIPTKIAKKEEYTPKDPNDKNAEYDGFAHMDSIVLPKIDEEKEKLINQDANEVMPINGMFPPNSDPYVYPSRYYKDEYIKNKNKYIQSIKNKNTFLGYYIGKYDIKDNFSIFKSLIYPNLHEFINTPEFNQALNIACLWAHKKQYSSIPHDMGKLSKTGTIYNQKGYSFAIIKNNLFAYKCEEKLIDMDILFKIKDTEDSVIVTGKRFATLIVIKEDTLYT
jgi:hypothetical protein